MVLVGSHSDEGRLREDMGAESRVFWAEAVVLIGLDNVKARLVFVHGVENYLHGGRDWGGVIDGAACFPPADVDWGPDGGWTQFMSRYTDFLDEINEIPSN